MVGHVKKINCIQMDFGSQHQTQQLRPFHPEPTVAKTIRASVKHKTEMNSIALENGINKKNENHFSIVI